MYITINDVIGEKMIDLSYPIQNFDSSNEVAVVSMLDSAAPYYQAGLGNRMLRAYFQ